MNAYSLSQKDVIVRDAFKILQSRGIASPWSCSTQPVTDLQNECLGLMEDVAFREDLAAYRRSHTAVSRAIQMLSVCVSIAAHTHWQDIPEDSKLAAERGWFLSRWIPTFLIIDGPVGRFMLGTDSPFRPRYGQQFPFLTAACEFINDRTFKLLRNGFAHWAFDWEIVGNDSFVIAYDWERDLPTAKLHQSEADSFHVIACALAEILENSILAQPMHTVGRSAIKCARCGETHSHNLYYCSVHHWTLCWNCVRKAALTNKLTCPKCGQEVHRVD